ncbi:Carboxypeptidase inhibitor SmCI [Lamellibrachia satsuma]|nr:Carboxypeptidase inhibitor SmCI [Lamellibrachia satsuma]
MLHTRYRTSFGRREFSSAHYLLLQHTYRITLVSLGPVTIKFQSTTENTVLKADACSFVQPDQVSGALVQRTLTGDEILKNNMQANVYCGLFLVLLLLAQSPDDAGALPEACNQPSETGDCRAMFIKWFYNANTGMCETFIYGGCDGNSNNFESEEECLNECLESLDDIEAGCRQPPLTGLCGGTFVRWYYNYAKEQCEMFVYGGCGGNSNNFMNESDCQNKCLRTMRASVCCCLFMFWLSYDTTTARSVPGVRGSGVPRQCRPSLCLLNCLHGRQVGRDGCQLCACYDPCETVKCLAPNRCVRKEALCTRASSRPPLGVCRLTRSARNERPSVEMPLPTWSPDLGPWPGPGPDPRVRMDDLWVRMQRARSSRRTSTRTRSAKECVQ